MNCNTTHYRANSSSVPGDPTFLNRPDAAIHAPQVRTAVAALIAGRDSEADETAALPLLLTLDRLGQSDDSLLQQALARPGSGVALAALRTLAARDQLPAGADVWLARFLAAGPSEPALRVVAEIFQRHPGEWQPALLLPLLAKSNAADFELTYALRLALKHHALTADVARLRTWAEGGDDTAGRIAEICLAVPTPAAATFLLEHLERTRAAAPRAGEFARHAIQHLPPDALASLRPLLAALERAPRLQRLAVAEGIGTVAAKPDRTLPDDIHGWMERELLAAVDDKDPALGLRALNALKPLALPGKAEVLRRVALAPGTRESNRIAALRALAPEAVDTTEVLSTILGSNGTNSLRRTAAELLGSMKTGPEARAALVAALPTASADLTLALAAALAKSDAGAAELVELAAAGRVRPALLKHRHLVLAFEARPPELRARVAALTHNLPPEDARLDALIAQRLGAASAAAARADVARGAELFARHCAACHRYRDTGGNLGPSLDGIGSRSLPRLVEDILDPSRNVDPAFRLTTVTLRNGETRSGLNLREAGERIQLTDPATGQDATLARSEIGSIAASPVSAMPPAFDSVLTEGEFFDLIEFLRQPAIAR